MVDTMVHVPANALQKNMMELLGLASNNLNTSGRYGHRRCWNSNSNFVHLVDKLHLQLFKKQKVTMEHLGLKEII